MQDVGAIRHRLKQAAYRHLKKRLEAGLKESPTNCVHNAKTDIEGRQVGVCRFTGWDAGEWPGVCDPKVKDCSKGCPHFHTKYPKDDIKASFRRFVAEAPLSELQAEGMPDVVTLLWVLGEDAPGRDVDLDTDPDTIEVYGIPIYADTIESRTALERLLSLVEDMDQHAMEGKQALLDRIEELEENEAELTKQLDEYSDLDDRVGELEYERSVLEQKLKEMSEGERNDLTVPDPPRTWWQKLFGVGNG